MCEGLTQTLTNDNNFLAKGPLMDADTLISHYILVYHLATCCPTVSNRALPLIFIFLYIYIINLKKRKNKRMIRKYIIIKM